MTALARAIAIKALWLLNGGGGSGATGLLGGEPSGFALDFVTNTSAVRTPN